MNKQENPETEKERERFIRWQGITIAQLSYSMHLILTLSMASLGFGVSLIVKDDFLPSSTCECAYYAFLILALLCLLFSIGFGICATLTRLIDFRITTRITKLKHKFDKRKFNNCEKIRKLESRTKKLGKKTWGTFYRQIGTFSIGIGLFIIAIAFPVVAKLTG